MALSKPIIVSIFFSVCCCWCPISCYSETETDTLKRGHQLKDEEYLVSAGRVFTLGLINPQQQNTAGYFNPENAQNCYVGIWYTYSERKTPVWIANRNKPISRTSGAIEISSNGDLKISDNGVTSLVLYSNQETARTRTVAVLTDTGNFVLREATTDGLPTGKVLWQSFDHPTDTLLPGMRLGFDFRTGQNWSLTSWVSTKVPALGSYTLGVDPNGTNQLILQRRGKIHWKSGIWKDKKFSNLKDYLYSFDFISNKHERYFVLSAVNTGYTSFPMYEIDEHGAINIVDIAQSNTYRNERVSSSLSEFVFCKSNYEVRRLGCTEQKLPDCRRTVYFESTRGLANSDGLKYDKGTHILGLDDCEAMCFNTCSCVAFANIYPNGTGCELWSSRAQFIEDGYNGYRDLYVQRHRIFTEGKRTRMIWLIVSGAVFLLILSLGWLGYRMKRTLLNVARFFGLLGYMIKRNITAYVCQLHDNMKRNLETAANQTEVKTLAELDSRAGYSGRLRRKRKITIGKKSHGIRVFSFDSIAQATANFAHINILGQGGFGMVYKGISEDGQEIAIKRLSKTSTQGRSEFMNEVKLLAKLQHTNLVRLIGCCIEQGEKILVYEYMQNKSLDYFLFDADRKLLIDWKMRFNVIEGVAQGLLYLHKYSRLKIIHRDLKCGNILLDDEMNPKISDFGMARLFELNESGANTSRVVGTLAYMPPEYALEGYFSVKSDVFSFGVLVLEIISSKKNTGSYCSDRPLNLIGYAWELWTENRGAEFIDNTLILSDSEHEEAMKCMNLGLVCVQEDLSDRPTMSTVVAMISNEANQLPNPKKPAFFLGNGAPRANCPLLDLEKGANLNVASNSEMEDS